MNVNGNQNGGNSFNPVAVAAAAELVNSILVKSEQQQQHHHHHQQQLNDNSHNIIHFSDLEAAPAHNQNEQGVSFNNSMGQQQMSNEQEQQQIDDEKDAKSKSFVFLF